MAEQQILCLKPAPRLEQVGDEHSERVQDRKHRSQGCDDSALRCESKAVWNFRKGQVSALPPKADVFGLEINVRYVPTADIVGVIADQMAGA